jgi:hypothetical protein
MQHSYDTDDTGAEIAVGEYRRDKLIVAHRSTELHGYTTACI